MRITPISNNQIQTQGENTNFSSRRVPGRLVNDFAMICPETWSLRERVANLDCGTGLIKKEYLSLFGDDEIFLEDQLELTRFEKAKNRALDAIRRVTEECRSGAFREGWECNHAEVGDFKSLLVHFLRKADPVKEEQIAASMPRVRATQDAFLKKK